MNVAKDFYKFFVYTIAQLHHDTVTYIKGDPMEELGTSDAQRKAVENYQKDKARFVLWYPSSVKDQLRKKGLSAREVFEYGLKHYGIKVPK